MKRYEYKTVSIAYGAANNTFDHYRAIIDEYAKKGYVFKTWVPVSISSSGSIKKIDLVFETEDTAGLPETCE